MLKSTLQPVRQLSDLLLQLPEIVRQFERKSPQTMGRLMDWMARAEDLLSTHRLVEAAEVAGLKARILAPADDDRRGTLRRRQQTVAVGLLYELQQSLQQALPRALKVEEARDLARQLLQIVSQSGAIRYDPALSLGDMVERIWLLCIQHEQLKPLAAQLKILLPTDDIRLLLAEELDPADFVAG